MKNNVKSLLLLFSMLFVLLPFAPEVSAEPLDEIRQIIRDYYIDDVPESVLGKKAAKEITRYLDPHSVYMSSEEYQGFVNGIEQRFVGIGVVLEADLKGIKVNSVIPQGPAMRAGIQPGDVITHVDGRSVVGEPVLTAVPLIGGPENTIVTITITRLGQTKPLTLSIKREVISIANVEFAMLGGNIGYIRLNSFATESAKEVNEAIQSLRGAEGWIVDLRNNGGGYITAAQDITGFFPNANNAFQIREKNGEPMIFRAIPQISKLSAPTHLLINANSASASEMVAAAVKEQKAATLYGQISYGKGTMQSMFDFKDGSVLKLTTARFYSPGGQPVNKVGVKPNVITEIGAELKGSHRDQLIAKLKGYKQLPKLINVPVEKNFTVEMNSQMNWENLDKTAIQLVQLGGGESEVAVEIRDDKTITIVPKNPLQAGEQYVLVVHPLWKGSNNNSMKQGIYVDVTVK